MYFHQNQTRKILTTSTKAETLRADETWASHQNAGPFQTISSDDASRTSDPPWSVLPEPCPASNCQRPEDEQTKRKKPKTEKRRRKPVRKTAPISQNTRSQKEETRSTISELPVQCPGGNLAELAGDAKRPQLQVDVELALVQHVRLQKKPAVRARFWIGSCILDEPTSTEEQYSRSWPRPRWRGWTDGIQEEKHREREGTMAYGPIQSKAAGDE